MNLDIYIKDSSVSSTCFRLLHLLASEGELTTPQVCEALKLSRHQIMNLLRILDSKGLVNINRKQGFGGVNFISLKE